MNGGKILQNTPVADLKQCPNGKWKVYTSQERNISLTVSLIVLIMG